MTTKKTMTLILIVLITSLSIQVFGQKNNKGRDRIKERKEQLDADRVVFYNNYLKLTTAESDKFWPLHKEYTQKQREAKQIFGKKQKELRNKSAEELTKEEGAELMKSQFQLKQSLLDLEKEYSLKFQAVITVQKVAKLKEAEAQFKKDFLKKARENKKQRINNKKVAN